MRFLVGHGQAGSYFFAEETTVKLCDVKGAAEALAGSLWTIRGYLRDEKSRPIRMGRLFLLDEPELERFVASATATPDTLGQGQMEEQG